MSYGRVNTPPVVLNLIIINVLFWAAASFVLPKFGIDLNSLLGLHYWSSSAFKPWQFITYMFLHDTSSLSHIFFNMFGLWMFGVVLERVWGGKKFLLFYLFTGVGAGVIQELTWMIDFAKYGEMFRMAMENNDGSYLSAIITNAQHMTLSDMVRMKDEFFSIPVTVGASGALFGILLAFGWLFPEQKMFVIFVPIPIPARIFVAIYAVIELLLGVRGFSVDNVAHFAHLGGMIFAAILLLIWKRQGRLYN